MSWSATNSSYFALEMEPASALGIPLETPVVIMGPSVSPSSDDAFGPDSQGQGHGQGQGHDHLHLHLGRGPSSNSDSSNSNSNSNSDRQSSISSSASGVYPSQSQTQQWKDIEIENENEKEKEKERATVPSACVQCRSKHLKCDGCHPCSRCSSNSFECEYVKSRRGFKGPRRNGIQNKASSVAAAPVDRSCPLVHPNGQGVRATPNVPSGLATPPDHRLMTLPRSVDLPLFDIGQEVVAFDPKALPSGLDLRERCIEAFFYHFYPAHPFTLPRSHHFALRKDKPIEYLEAAMRYVGSIYISQAPTMALALEAERLVYQSDCPNDAFKVQAMLILAIGLDGYTYQEKALRILLDAQDLALEIGMNTREFAFLHGAGSPIWEESWRRTWWELYITDGMIAGVHQKSTFRLKEMHADVALPCEEREYMSGVR